MTKKQEQESKKEQPQSENEQVIKISYRKMIEYINSGKLAQLEKKGLQTKISIWLGRVMDKIEDELQKVFQKKQNEINDRYAEVDDNGKKKVKVDYGDGRKEYVIKKNMEEEKEREMKELLDYEADIHIYKITIKTSQLPDTMQPAETRVLDAIANLVDDKSVVEK